MSEIVLANAVQREKGYLYYLDKEGNVCRAKMGRAKKDNPNPTSNPAPSPVPSAEQVVNEIEME